MTKDRTINLRVSSEWLDRVDAAAKALSDAVGVTVSRNEFIERTLEIRCGAIERGDPPNAGLPG